MLDLANIDTPKAAETGHEIELTYNDKPTGWFVTVLGEYAPTVKKWQLSVGNTFRIKEWREKRRKSSDAPEPMTEEDLELGLKGAAARIVGMRGITFEKKPFDFTPENAYQLVRRHPPFADQILEASGDISNFTKAQ